VPQTGERAGEQVLEETLVLDGSPVQQLRHPVGVAQQPADAERILRRQCARFKHRGEGAGLLHEERSGGSFADCGRRGAKLERGDVAVQGVVLPHRRHERTREIDAHFPHHATGASGLGDVAEGSGRGGGQLSRPRVQARIPRRPARLVEGVHPLCQVVEVLAVPVPLQALVERLLRSALGQRLADAQAAAGRVPLGLVASKPTDPPGARVVVPVSAEHAMDLIH
jgi:hypothetical protein